MFRFLRGYLDSVGFGDWFDGTRGLTLYQCEIIFRVLSNKLLIF